MDINTENTKNQDFLQDVLDEMQEHGKTSAQVVWVGVADGSASTTWEGFVAAVMQTFMPDYCSGISTQEIPVNFVVVGEDWWIAREDNGGFMEFLFYTKPVKTGNGPLQIGGISCSH